MNDKIIEIINCKGKNQRRRIPFGIFNDKEGRPPISDKFRWDDNKYS